MSPTPAAYREYTPPPAWRDALECGWEARPPAGARPAHGVLPDGCMDLVWNGAELLVAGPDTLAQPVRGPVPVRAAGLRFRPGALPGLLGVPAAALRDTRVPLRDLHPAVAREAEGRIAGGGRVVEVLLGAAGRIAGGAAAPDPGVRAVAARLAAGASAAETADSLGWTTRTLHRHSLAAFGYGPAVLRRVLRFRRATVLLQAGVAPGDAAARAGYSDQPHLSREVRALSGLSPTALARG